MISFFEGVKYWRVFLFGYVKKNVILLYGIFYDIFFTRYFGGVQLNFDIFGE